MVCLSICIVDLDIYELYGWIKIEVKSCVRLYCKIEILFILIFFFMIVIRDGDVLNLVRIGVMYLEDLIEYVS